MEPMLFFKEKPKRTKFFTKRCTFGYMIPSITNHHSNFLMKQNLQYDSNSKTFKGQSASFMK